VPLTGWLFFFVAIFPTMGVITFTNVIASDKYVYLPVFGLLMVLAFVLVKLWDAPLSRIPRGVARAGLVVIVLGLGVAEARATRGYLHYWKDTVTLYRYMLTFSPGAWSLYDYLGVQYCNSGQLDEAVAQYRKALELRPNEFAVHNNLGVALANQAMAQGAKGDMAGAQIRFAEAMENFAQAIRANPKFASAYSNMGRALQNVGENDQAQTNFERALEIDPLCVDAHQGLGVLLAEQRKFAEAEVHFRDAVRIHPAYIAGYIGLGRTLEAQRKFSEAFSVYLDAQRLDPHDPRVPVDLARVGARLVPTSLPALTTQPGG
jgi:tetratricopeptide (TPR) repeat protein